MLKIIAKEETERIRSRPEAPIIPFTKSLKIASVFFMAIDKTGTIQP
jgi:hypothetical protein